MKVKKFKFKQILKLHFLNLRIYEHLLKKSQSATVNDSNVIQVIGSFKKSLQVIYAFHKLNKRILFIGVPKKLELKINKQTHHLAVPKNFRLQYLSVKNQPFLSLDETTNSNVLSSKSTTHPDLIVLFSSEKMQNIINESFSMKIPLINFEAQKVSIGFLSKRFYQVELGNRNSNLALDKTFFLLGLNFLFKKI